MTDPDPDEYDIKRDNDSDGWGESGPYPQPPEYDEHGVRIDPQP